MHQSKRIVGGFLFAAAMTGSMLVATSVGWAQQKPLKEQLAGAWTMVSWDVTPKGGTKEPSFIVGPNPKGIMILDASGRFAQVRGRPDRPKLKVTSPRQDIPAAELSEAVRSFGANFGTWTVNEADKALIQKFELALIPNNDTNEVKYSVSLIKDQLRLVSVTSAGTTNELVYRRAK